ncbi:TniQ family protein [Psychrosphaera sp. B3R10]|uniref:TniQ family protein n=1 Tax=unclassified Psychrosphaera TaxID=2641570 RepID=UPI001C09DB1F|nr:MULTISPECIES: TniQ family protein [unclassified Psychrosphaera]MBU2882337.1 TniQ family protein [Psychrosphaera sp. I2R16]MBU2989018.1 TniQ family protein [Psychrosphaera sp. B3R10]
MLTSQLLNESLITQLAKYARGIGSSYFEDIVTPKQLTMISTNKLNGLHDELLNNLRIKRFSKEKSEISHARVCPLCIEENNVHYQEFQSKEVMVCPVHLCLLVDLCPHCSESLVFDLNLFRGICTNYRCHKKLEAVYPPNCFYELSQQQINDCLHAGLFEKHFGLGQLPVKKSYFIEVSQLTLRGYELLTLKADNIELLQSVRDHYSAASIIPGFIEYLQKTMLGSLTLQWPWCGQVFNNNVIDDDLRSLDGSLFVGSKLFCLALGISPVALDLMFDADLVNVDNGCRLNNKSIINIMPFITHLTSLPQLPNGESFETFLKANPGFRIGLDELLAAWLHGDIDISFVRSKTLFNSIIVESECIRNWLLKYSTKVTKQKLNSKEALNVLRTSKRKYLSLIENGTLRAVKSESGFIHRFDDVAAIKHQLSRSPQLSFFN